MFKKLHLRKSYIYFSFQVKDKNPSVVPDWSQFKSSAEERNVDVDATVDFGDLQSSVSIISNDHFFYFIFVEIYVSNRIT